MVLTDRAAGATLARALSNIMSTGLFCASLQMHLATCICASRLYIDGRQIRRLLRKHNWPLTALSLLVLQLEV